MNEIELKKLEKNDKSIFDEFYSKDYFESSKHNFTNFYMWRDRYNIYWTLEDDILFIFSLSDKSIKVWQPVCSSEKRREAVEKVLRHKKDCSKNKKFMFFSLEKFFVDELKKIPDLKIEIDFNRDTSDYVYLAEDLINLKGRKYHSKKNHLNRFYELYPNAEYLPISADIIEQCRIASNHWYEIASDENPHSWLLSHEKQAICEIFDDFDFFKLKGGAYLVDGKVAAFTFGEKLNSDTAVIHVEKADPEIRGAYPAINQGFVANEWSQIKFINREEDLGLEGLRKAKESYKPIKMIEKFNAVIK